MEQGTSLALGVTSNLASRLAGVPIGFVGIATGIVIHVRMLLAFRVGPEPTYKRKSAGLK